MIDSNWLQKLSGANWVSYFSSILGFLAYHTICEGFYGASLGKLICKLRVLSKDGSPCKVHSALIRSLGFFIDSLFFGLIGYLSMSGTPLKQRFGDKWGKTIVVTNDQVPEASRYSTSRLVVVLLIGIVLRELIIFLRLLYRIM